MKSFENFISEGLFDKNKNECIVEVDEKLCASMERIIKTYYGEREDIGRVFILEKKPGKPGKFSVKLSYTNGSSLFWFAALSGLEGLSKK